MSVVGKLWRRLCFRLFQLLNIFLIVYFDLEKTKMVTIVFR